MRRILGALLLAAVTSVSAESLACGGGYGAEVTIKPSQTIAVVVRSGQESYIFRPHFCGAATEFGLILPIPAALTQNPTLADAKLFDELEAIAAPSVETVEVCAQSSFLASGSKGGDQAAPANYTADGVYVVSSGTVGQFQWELLKADSSQSFTDWLDANHFAYPAGAPAAFSTYVQAGWYFVAFRVAAGSTAPPSGYRLCGDFGPIELSFPTSAATIPTRIATANDPNSNFNWRVLAIADHEQAVPVASWLSPYQTAKLTYAGKLTSSDLGAAPAVAGIANAGQWFTAYDVTFTGNNTPDLVLAEAAADTAFRDRIYVYKEVTCGVFGCSVNPHARSIPMALTLAMLGGVLVFALRRR